MVLRERGPLSIPDVVALVESLARAIDYAAARGVHHGLLHLRDIMLAADAVRITGFGIAAALSNVGAKLPARPQYAAPVRRQTCIRSARLLSRRRPASAHRRTT